MFIDRQDGWIDGGNFLLNYSYAVLPVPMIITEPAFGEGLGVAAVVFHDAAPVWEGVEVDPDTGRSRPRRSSAVALAATCNNSQLFGAGHFGCYRGDSIRYEAVGGAADINLKFHGLGGAAENRNGLRFNADALFISQDLAFRLSDSNWFLGGDFQYTDMETKFDTDTDFPGLDSVSFDSKNVAVDAVAVYDSLSNNFTPRKG